MSKRMLAPLLVASLTGCGPASDRVQAIAGAFDSRHEADRLAEFWGEAASIREMMPYEGTVAYEVNVAGAERKLTVRFIQQAEPEVDLFSGTASSEDIERVRSYLESRFAMWTWQPALGHKLGGAGEEQWRIRR